MLMLTSNQHQEMSHFCSLDTPLYLTALRASWHCSSLLTGLDMLISIAHLHSSGLALT